MTAPLTPEALADQIEAKMKNMSLLGGDELRTATHALGALAYIHSTQIVRALQSEAALQQVTAERDEWKATLRYCEHQWQDERGAMLDRLATATAEAASLRAVVEALKGALKQIADACPVTCDMSVAHDMAATAEHALARAAKEEQADA